ncbi:P-loop containing nucleoside triphosphate hydrolase protein [Pisolithus sp. B1]|nr:P-loop containing nucleoside triphosphate hydrolase protein [Pisolithus sp. B1]
MQVCTYHESRRHVGCARSARFLRAPNTRRYVAWACLHLTNLGVLKTSLFYPFHRRKCPSSCSANDSTMTQSPPLGLNVILIGNSSVGKTCLHRRFLDERSSLNVTATYRVDVLYQNMQVDGRHVKLGIRDTAGMERFRSITAAYYRDVQGVILVYNITDATSFNALPGWLAEIENYIPSSVPKMIVGNKLDQVCLHQPFLSQHHFLYLATTPRPGHFDITMHH